ncbi:MAG: cytochrome c [Acetobacteraceae bacterium]|nr:cytochrome c [Acetobacteraceae bacterium]
MFAAQCGWCHNDYGMKAGKGPKLAGTRMNEKQVHDRIRDGKTDAMPPFRRTLTEEQITALAQYIKSLPAQD